MSWGRGRQQMGKIINSAVFTRHVRLLWSLYAAVALWKPINSGSDCVWFEHRARDELLLKQIRPFLSTRGVNVPVKRALRESCRSPVLAGKARWNWIHHFLSLAGGSGGQQWWDRLQNTDPRLLRLYKCSFERTILKFQTSGDDKGRSTFTIYWLCSDFKYTKRLF